jgi:hypothetical protein
MTQKRHAPTVVDPVISSPPQPWPRLNAFGERRPTADRRDGRPEGGPTVNPGRVVMDHGQRSAIQTSRLKHPNRCADVKE